MGAPVEVDASQQQWAQEERANKKEFIHKNIKRVCVCPLVQTKLAVLDVALMNDQMSAIDWRITAVEL